MDLKNTLDKHLIDPALRQKDRLSNLLRAHGACGARVARFLFKTRFKREQKSYNFADFFLKQVISVHLSSGLCRGTLK